VVAGINMEARFLLTEEKALKPLYKFLAGTGRFGKAFGDITLRTDGNTG